MKEVRWGNCIAQELRIASWNVQAIFKLFHLLPTQLSWYTPNYRILWILKAYPDQKLIKQTDKKSASVYEPLADKILKLQIAGNEEGTCIFTLLTSFLKALTGQPCIFKWCVGRGRC